MEPGISAVVVTVGVAVCLWLLFRRGSMADRARPGAEAMDAEATNRPDDVEGPERGVDPEVSAAEGPGPD